MATIKREHSLSTDDDDATLHAARRPRLDQADEKSGIHFICVKTDAARHIQIVANGDLTIVVGRGIHNTLSKADFGGVAFTVRSTTVFAASHILKTAFLNGQSEEQGLIVDDGIIYLHEDDPKPMGTLLQIMHTHFEKVPERPDIIEIHDTAALADKYDLLRLLRSWARQWIQHLNQQSIHNDFSHACRCLKISWIFGDAHLFKSMLDTLASRARVYTEIARNQANPYQLGFNTYGVPDIYVIVGKLRLRKLKAILKPLGKSVDNLIREDFSDSTGVECRLYTTHEYDEECNQKLLATLLQSLTQANLWPVLAAESVNNPFSLILKEVGKLTVACEPRHKGRNRCGNIFTQSLASWEKELPEAVLTDAQLKHLKAQGEKTGLVLQS